jgi:hypothetical protein
MHREIADFKGVLERLDHKNRDGLDNQWENLRPASLSQNMANRTSFQGSSSKYKGVDWYRKTQKWRAQIRQNNRGFHIGYFFFEEDAARAYDEQARLRFGEFARLNFPATPSELPATVS